MSYPRSKSHAGLFLGGLRGLRRPEATQGVLGLAGLGQVHAEAGLRDGLEAEGAL